MKLAVVGSRKFQDEYLVRGYVFYMPRDVEIVSGGADGPDTWAVDEARKLGTPHHVFWPQTDKYGVKRALFERNNEIAYDADVMLAFMVPGGSSGTLHAVGAMRKLGKRAFVVTRPGDVTVAELLVALAKPAL